MNRVRYTEPQKPIPKWSLAYAAGLDALRFRIGAQ